MTPILDRVPAPPPRNQAPPASPAPTNVSAPADPGPSRNQAPTAGERALADEARRAGLVVLASAAWPESTVDAAPPELAGFVVSTFSPLVAEGARRCLTRAPDGTSPDAVTAIVLASARGDVASAVHVAGAVDAGTRVGPLMFFQSVPNAVAGYVAARWRLTGPVVCVTDPVDAVAVARSLIADRDADRVLVVTVEQACDDTESDAAAAVLLAARPPADEGGSP